MLTKQQRSLLLFVNDHIREHGFSPTFIEMRKHLGIASSSGVYRLLTALEERRFVRRLHGRSRAIEVLRLPEDATAPVKYERGPKVGENIRTPGGTPPSMSVIMSMFQPAPKRGE